MGRKGKTSVGQGDLSDAALCSLAAAKAGVPIEVVRNTRQCPNDHGLVLVD
jgi:hypothetical protein